MLSRILPTRRAVFTRATGTTRAFATSTIRCNNGSDGPQAPGFPFNRGPAPPRLPKEEQEIFEDLQRRSTGAFSTPRVNQSPDSQEAADGQQQHPDKVAGVKPEFEGEKNPKTGEVGGPKNEPLRWGAEGDWSYGGRVTDF